MKRFFLFVFSLVCFFAFSEVNAQSSAQSSMSSKDEFWGTSKVQTKGTSTDAVGRRGLGMDTRFNTYEDNGRKKRFEKNRIANSKRMKEILKKEEQMMKKHKKDQRRLKRQRRN